MVVRDFELLFSRGCIGDCIFCYFNNYKLRWSNEIKTLLKVLVLIRTISICSNEVLYIEKNLFCFSVCSAMISKDILSSCVSMLSLQIPEVLH